LNDEINIICGWYKYYTLHFLNNKLFVNDQPVNAENILTDEQLTKLNESLNLQETTALITEMTGGKTVITSVLHSTDWNNQGVYSFESTYPSATYDIEQIQPYGDIDQVKAWNEADIVGNPNSNILACRGTVPNIDISIMYYIRRKQVN
jgi:D-alanyl-D-alanine carboxypeptidase